MIASTELVAYLPVAVILLMAITFCVVNLAATHLLGPRRSGGEKSETYESGMTPIGTARRRFNIRFYILAMTFLVFDIEIIFLYPWAVANKELGLFGLVAMTIFAGIFFLSFVYELAKGGLNWGPGRRLLTPATSPERTTNSTIRKVGLEGRLDLEVGANDSEAE